MSDITALLNAGGAAPDLDAVFQRVYPELKRYCPCPASVSMGSKTLSATARVNEAYLELVQSELVQRPLRTMNFRVVKQMF